MQYLKAIDGVVVSYPYPIYQLKKDNPDVSFPIEPSYDLLAEWNLYPVITLDRPTYNGLIQTASRTEPQNINGTWVVDWLITDLPQNEAESNIRYHRNTILSECDWTQVADAPVDKTTWAKYRQELRDITSQPTFPYLVSWPSKPE